MRSFLKSVLATFTALVLFSSLGIVAIGAGFVFLAASSSKDVRPEIEANTVLRLDLSLPIEDAQRSEERRVGKECRSRGSPYH